MRILDRMRVKASLLKYKASLILDFIYQKIKGGSFYASHHPDTSTGNWEWQVLSAETSLFSEDFCFQRRRAYRAMEEEQYRTRPIPKTTAITMSDLFNEGLYDPYMPSYITSINADCLESHSDSIDESLPPSSEQVHTRDTKVFNDTSQVPNQHIDLPPETQNTRLRV